MSLIDADMLVPGCLNFGRWALWALFESLLIYLIP